MHAGLPAEVRAGALDDAGRYIGIAHPFAEGETFAALIERRGARHFNEVLPLLWAVAEAPLSALHAEHLVHGSLHAGNVLVVDATPSAPGGRVARFGLVLPAAGADHGSKRHDLEFLDRKLSRAISRRQRLSAPATCMRSACSLHQLLSGKAPFSGPHAVDALLGHLTQNAEPLSFVAAGNGATPAVEAFVRSLLEKGREQRPRDAGEAIEGLRRIWRSSTRPPTWVTE